MGKLLFTGSKQHRLSSIYLKRKKISTTFAQNNLTPYWGNKGNYKGDAVVKYMIRTQDEISFWQILVFRIWAAGTKEPPYVWYSASCSGKPTQSQWLAPEADNFLWAIGTEQKAVENGECRWVAQFLLLELTINCYAVLLGFSFATAHRLWRCLSGCTLHTLMCLHLTLPPLQMVYIKIIDRRPWFKIF